MAGRVTQSMMSNQLIMNLNRNLRKMDDQQNQLSTGRRINRPSDDPVGITFSMRYRNELSSNEQYISNADDSRSWLDYSDTMLSQTGDVFQRVRQLVVQGSNGTNSPAALNAIKSEVQQLSGQLVNIGNSQFNGRYVFNGQMTEVKPYDGTITTDPVTGDQVYNAAANDTDNGDIQFETGTGVQLGVNVTGQQMFGSSADSDNAFKVMQNIVNSLAKGDTKGLSGLLGTIDSRMNKILQIRADIGAKTNRLDLAQGRLTDISTNLAALQSKVEDVDVAALITNLKVSENVYQASLSAGSRLIKPTLMDFLN